MKRFLVLSIILTFSVLHGQTRIGFYTGAGYGGIIPSSQGIDDFVAAYNGQRFQVITKKMESPRMFDGISFHLGTIASNVVLEFGYFSSSAKIFSEADPAKVPAGTISRRDIKLIYSGIKFSIGWIFGKEIVFAGPILEMPIATLKGETTTIYGKQDNFDIDNYFGISPGVFLMLGTPGDTGAFFTAKATYTFGLGNPDWGLLYYNTQTNIGGASGVPMQKGPFGGFTLGASLSVSLGCL